MAQHSTEQSTGKKIQLASTRGFPTILPDPGYPIDCMIHASRKLSPVTSNTYQGLDPEAL